MGPYTTKYKFSKYSRPYFFLKEEFKLKEDFTRMFDYVLAGFDLIHEDDRLKPFKGLTPFGFENGEYNSKDSRENFRSQFKYYAGSTDSPKKAVGIVTLKDFQLCELDKSFGNCRCFQKRNEKKCLHYFFGIVELLKVGLERKGVHKELADQFDKYKHNLIEYLQSGEMKMEKDRVEAPEVSRLQEGIHLKVFGECIADYIDEMAPLFKNEDTEGIELDEDDMRYIVVGKQAKWLFHQKRAMYLFESVLEKTVYVITLREDTFPDYDLKSFRGINDALKHVIDLLNAGDFEYLLGSSDQVIIVNNGDEPFEYSIDTEETFSRKISYLLSPTLPL